MAGAITWLEDGEPHGVVADEEAMAQVFTVLAAGAARTARTSAERAVAAWLAWHDVTVYGKDAQTIALDEIPWTGDPEALRAFLRRAVDRLAGDGWTELFEVWPKVAEVQGVLGRLRTAVDRADLARAEPSDEDTALPKYGRCLLHVVPLHRFGCIVCNQDELFGALSRVQCLLAGKLLSSGDPAERSEAARLLAVEAAQEPSRITLCALAHVHALAVEREPPGLLRTYLLSTIGVCARQAGESLQLRHVAPLAAVVSILDGWDAAQAASILDALESEEPAATFGDA